MSSKAMARQRIVPAIPHQLSIRRAKVAPAGKSDQQIADDKGKSATPPVKTDKAPTHANAIEKEDAHQADKPAAHSNGVKEEVKQTPAEKEVVALKEPAQDNETFEQETAIKSKKEIAEKGVTHGVKNSNEVTAPRRQPHHQDAQALPFIPKHQPKHSETLVFGGLQDSSSASPANLTNAFVPPPAMSVMPPNLAPYEGYVPAQQYAPTPAPLAAMAAPPVNGHAFQYANGAATQLGSMSSSPSRTPSVPLGDAAATAAAATPDIHMPYKHHAQQSSYAGLPPFDNNAQHIADFVQSYWGQTQFADLILELYSGDQPNEPLMLPVHSLIIARYPGLLKLIHSLPRTITQTRAPIVHVPRSYCFQDASAFAEAVRYVYGSPLIDPMYIFGNPSGTPSTRMRFALSYLAAGHCLGAEPIVVHAYNIAYRILGAHELETVLFFAACGYCLSGNSLYGPYGDHIVWQAVIFMVSHLQPGFFDASATELASLPRISNMDNSASTSQSRPDSRSSSVFASSDAQSTQRPGSNVHLGSTTPSSSDAGSVNYVLSSALLSMPFELLRHVLEHEGLVRNLGIDAALTIAGDVVRERERRRIDACTALQDQKRAPEGILLFSEAVGRDASGTRVKLFSTRFG
ncbi:hypothetical protein E4T47_04385 [Aureobasidium subglaciale]|nr:hypothetical protein E4T47_04385 [Aureobasidium subglaciale]